MSVLVRGMEMPKNCTVCPMHHYYFPPTTFASDELTVKAVSICMGTRRELNSENCPLIPIPPHGRLIDADTLFEKVYEFYGEDCETAENWMMGKINDAPTIIPAEKGEE